MAKRSTCALCDTSNLASICAACVNPRLHEYYHALRSMKGLRESHFLRLTEKLEAKKKADDQLNWRVIQKEKIKKLKDQLSNLERQVAEEKAKVKEASNDLKLRNEDLNITFAKLEKIRVELLEKYPDLIRSQSSILMDSTTERLKLQALAIKQICRLFPMRRVNLDGEQPDGYSGAYDQICNARLPGGLDPHSVPSEELAASLGYMVQLLNLVIPILAAPSLHNSGFAGSCSRIWQRDSYWVARPSSQSKEYPLFIPRPNVCLSGGENSWSEKSSSNFVIASMEPEKKPFLETAGSGSFNYSSASAHSIETHKDLQKGISLLKKSVACITASCFNSLYLDAPSETSTFEAFGRLLATLCSSKGMQSTIMSWSRFNSPARPLNRSVWNINSGVSSISSLMDSIHRTPIPRDNIFSSTAASFLYSAEATEHRNSESLVEGGWDIVEHPRVPPPSSPVEDLEHWVRAMSMDATKKKPGRI